VREGYPSVRLPMSVEPRHIPNHNLSRDDDGTGRACGANALRGITRLTSKPEIRRATTSACSRFDRAKDTW
jgi:hypothetical protein